MDAAIRWSPHASAQRPHFLIVDVTLNRLRLCSVESVEDRKIRCKSLCVRDKLPNYTAFDWSKTAPYYVAIGAASGEANLVQIDPERSSREESIWSFPIKHQRRCNTIAFSTKNYLVTGLDRVRNDFCMNIYDLNIPSPASQEPYRKLAVSEAISSIKFFPSQPDTLVAGVYRQCVRLYDLRDSSTSGFAQFPTRQVHNIAIDPLDENYFISAGPPGEPVVSVWDRRFASRASPTTPQEGPPPGPVLEIKPAVDNSHSSAIWSLRFSGIKRGCFGILASTGEIKIIELAQHSAKQLTGMTFSNPYGGTHWQQRHYIRTTHNLKYPWYSEMGGEQHGARVIAYDFMVNSGIGRGAAAIALHQNREIDLLNIPTVPVKVNITSLDELCIMGEKSCFLRPTIQHISVAEDLKALQEKAELAVGPHQSYSRNAAESPADIEKLSIDNFGKLAIHNEGDQSYEPSSEELHEELLALSFPAYKPTIHEALRILRTQRRRCNEGYLFNYSKNKEIVANDPWLVEMWDSLKRFEDMAKAGGMRSSGLILDYLGVYAIWNNTFDVNHRNRSKGNVNPTEDEVADAITKVAHSKGYPPYRGIKTAQPAHRQLCLALCGWTFSKDRLRIRCHALMEEGQIYKAIVIAVFRGFRDLALELLKHAIQTKQIYNIGLAAVIACETVTEEQRGLCSWMKSETDDAYLRALLSYFVNGDWKVVAEMPQLALSDRVGVALKYLDDDRLSEFLALETHRTVVSGNIEGIILTGLTCKTLDLFTQYVAKFSDLQTCVLAMSFVCPVFLADARFELWRDLYFLQMQSWRAFSERAQYIVAHRALSVAPDGHVLGRVQPNHAQLACSYCHKSFAFRRTTAAAAAEGSDPGSRVSPVADTLITTSTPRRPFTKTPAAHNGLLCPSCGHRMPTCGICGLLLGRPDPRSYTTTTGNSNANRAAAPTLATPSSVVAAAPSTSGAHNTTAPRGLPPTAPDDHRHSSSAATAASSSAAAQTQEDPLARLVLYCFRCQHAFHAGHAREWFAKHRMCPVPECRCMCGLLH